MNMWEFWILLLASNFMTAHFLTEPLSTLNHLEVTYGQQLGIMLSSVTQKLEFTSTKNLQSIIIWSGSSQAKKGEVVKSGEEKRFIIKSVTFDDQGNYTEWNFWDKVTTIHLVKVTSKRQIQGCMPDKNLSISLDGLSKNDVTLQFSSKDFNHTLVKHGLPMDNQIPGYWGRIQVTTKNIQVFTVDGSDVGKYTLSDRENNTVMILNLIMGGCDLQTTQLKLKHGEELRINLPIWFKKLEFSSVNEVQSVLWPSCDLDARKYVKGSGYKRDYIIHPVTFNDKGTYTRWNYKDKESSIYELDVVCATHIQDCVVGKNLSIFLDGLAKDGVTLRFTNQDSNITLVEHGSPVGNSNHFSERIQVTGKDIQVLNIDVTDMGNYTLFDHENRMVKVITPNFI
ncbi:DNA-directed RNA polymerase II subunit RPB1-like isoform X2, partial [Clarias magur]